MRGCKHPEGSSLYRGISRCKGTDKWRVVIYLNGKQEYLGLFKSEIDSALMYDRRAKELFGTNAILNFCENISTPIDTVRRVKGIRLTQNKIAFVSNEDFERVSKYNWCAVFDRVQWKAAANIKGKFVYMHRFILNAPYNKDIDHINHNQLDNCRCNLRLCNESQNGANQRQQKGKSSKFKGVCWDKDKGKWMSKLGFKNKSLYLGRFDDEIVAAKIYDRAAIKYFGDFALTNAALGLIKKQLV